jgi:Mrp family chromosome partitioning ATPase
LFEELKRQYDYIIIDTPPVGILSDAKVIASYADLELYIVRQRFTSKRSIPEIDKLVNNGNFTNLSVVINDISQNGSYDYNGYKYSKYSYQYINENENWLKKTFKRAGFKK